MRNHDFDAYLKNPIFGRKMGVAKESGASRPYQKVDLLTRTFWVKRNLEKPFSKISGLTPLPLKGKISALRVCLGICVPNEY